MIKIFVSRSNPDNFSQIPAFAEMTEEKILHFAQNDREKPKREAFTLGT
jgi:hypothetical protein